MLDIRGRWLKCSLTEDIERYCGGTEREKQRTHKEKNNKQCKQTWKQDLKGVEVRAGEDARDEAFFHQQVSPRILQLKTKVFCRFHRIYSPLNLRFHNLGWPNPQPCNWKKISPADETAIIEFGFTCQVRVRFESEQHYLLHYQRDGNSECFATGTGDDPEKYAHFIGIWISHIHKKNEFDVYFYLKWWVHAVCVVLFRGDAA